MRSNIIILRTCALAPFCSRPHIRCLIVGLFMLFGCSFCSRAVATRGMPQSAETTDSCCDLSDNRSSIVVNRLSRFSVGLLWPPVRISFLRFTNRAKPSNPIRVTTLISLPVYTPLNISITQMQPMPRVNQMQPMPRPKFQGQGFRYLPSQRERAMPIIV